VGPLNGFALIATAAVPVVIVVYMLVSIGCIVYYLGPGRSELNPLLHVVMPIAGIVLFFFPLYYQFVNSPPANPVKIGNWIALAWFVIGVVLTVWVTTSRPERLRDMERVYVEDDDPTAAGPQRSAPASAS
jgi:amino acid transporter